MNKKNKLKRKLGFLAMAIATGVAPMANAAIDTAGIDAFQADAMAWVAHGLTVFLAIAGAGLAIVAARWLYQKIKSAISAS